MANKYHYGLKNAYYAILTETTDVETGNITESYGTPKRLLGAVSVDLSANGSSDTIYADDIGFATLDSNQGYTGSLEIVDMSNDAYADIFGMIKSEDSKGLTEYADGVIKKVALLFEIQGDENATRYCFFRCSFGRPSVSSSTKKESIDAQNIKCDIKCLPRLSDEAIKHAELKGGANYETWFTAVPVVTKG